MFGIPVTQSCLPEVYQILETGAPVDYHQACELQLSQLLHCLQVVLKAMMLTWTQDLMLVPVCIYKACEAA
jgi:hypothetical protein